jgi:hypothetical protein
VLAILFSGILLCFPSVWRLSPSMLRHQGASAPSLALVAIGASAPGCFGPQSGACRHRCFGIRVLRLPVGRLSPSASCTVGCLSPSAFAQSGARRPVQSAQSGAARHVTVSTEEVHLPEGSKTRGSPAVNSPTHRRICRDAAAALTDELCITLKIIRTKLLTVCIVCCASKHLVISNRLPAFFLLMNSNKMRFSVVDIIQVGKLP